jgi:ABC-type transport system involved in multi-copper enzyme maturation permease subunit
LASRSAVAAAQRETNTDPARLEALTAHRRTEARNATFASVNPLNEVALIMAREVRKNLRGVKGIVLLSISLIGGTLMALAVVKLFTHQIGQLPVEQLQAAQEAAFAKAYNDAAMGKYLASAPLPLVIMLGFCVWLAPALIWLAGFDAISGEVQYRSIRYWTLRTRRASYYVGKFFGLWATVAAITFAMHLLMWIVTIAQGTSSFGDTMSWGVRFWLVTIPIIGAWCGIAVFVGSFARAPVTSLLLVGITFFIIFLLGAITPRMLVSIRSDPDDLTARILAGLYPNTYDAWLLSPRFDRASFGFLICCAFAGLPTAAGAYLLGRKDV